MFFQKFTITGPNGESCVGALRYPKDGDGQYFSKSWYQSGEDNDTAGVAIEYYDANTIFFDRNWNGHGDDVLISVEFDNNGYIKEGSYSGTYSIEIENIGSILSYIFKKVPFTVVAPDFGINVNVEDYVWNNSEFKWDLPSVIAGGGRFKKQLVVVGHQKIYFGDL